MNKKSVPIEDVEAAFTTLVELASTMRISDPNWAFPRLAQDLLRQLEMKATWSARDPRFEKWMLALRELQKANEWNRPFIVPLVAPICERYPTITFPREVALRIAHDLKLLCCAFSEILGKGEDELSPNDVVDYMTELYAPTSRCELPPPGWTCSRRKHHEGPCAASPKVEK